MNKFKTMFAIVVFLVFMVGLSSSLFATFIYCKDAFPNGCTQGGCEAATSASGCVMTCPTGGNVNCTIIGGKNPFPLEPY